MFAICLNDTLACLESQEKKKKKKKSPQPNNNNHQTHTQTQKPQQNQTNHHPEQQFGRDVSCSQKWGWSWADPKGISGPGPLHGLPKENSKRDKNKWKSWSLMT